MRKLSNWFYKVSTGWVALFGLVVFLLFTAFVLPAQAEEADAINLDVGSPDTSFFYSAEQLYEIAEAYGLEGRLAYIRARFTFDLIWPLVYTFFLTTAISWTFKSVFSGENPLMLANLAPFWGMIFDFAENVSTSLVVYIYPARLDIVALIAPFFTAIKWVLVGGSFVFLLIGILGKVWQAVQKKLNK
jgi:hypothetical protein